MTEYVERTLRGTLRQASSGRARLELVTGTMPASALQPSQFSQLARPDFAHELPVGFDLTVRARAFDVDPVGDDRARPQDVEYRRSVTLALPRAFPVEAVGPGARWEVVTRDAGQVSTTTWDVSAIDGSRVTLTSSSFSHRVRATIDLATFSVEADVTYQERTGGWSQDGARATLSVGAVYSAP